jgi:hypothetical protein
MRKLVIAVVLLMALGVGAQVAQASPVLSWVELGFKSSIDGVVYDSPYGSAWPPTGAVFSAGFLATGLGTVTYTFSAPGTHYVAAFFDYQFEEPLVSNGIFDEFAYWGGGSVPAGWSGRSDDPWGAGTPFPPPIYAQFTTFDALNSLNNWVFMSPEHDVSVALGYAFTLNAGDPAKKVIFRVSDAPLPGFFIQQEDGPSQQSVYFSGTTQDVGGPVIPEPGTLTLLGLGLAAAARRLRRRA